MTTFESIYARKEHLCREWQALFTQVACWHLIDVQGGRQLHDVFSPEMPNIGLGLNAAN